MDVQSALDQMKTLLSARPQVVYKTAYYRKQTKNHWARDDPAFGALQGLFLLISALAYSVAFRITVTGALGFILYTVFWVRSVHWFPCGLCRLSYSFLLSLNSHTNTHPHNIGSFVRSFMRCSYWFACYRIGLVSAVSWRPFVER
jgi:hypothetical protein